MTLTTKLIACFFGDIINLFWLIVSVNIKLNFARFAQIKTVSFESIRSSSAAIYKRLSISAYYLN